MVLLENLVTMSLHSVPLQVFYRTYIDPYVEFKANGRIIGKSEVINNNLNPSWNPIEVDIAAAGGIQLNSTALT